MDGFEEEILVLLNGAQKERKDSKSNLKGGLEYFE